jgi:hypothetical protein
MVRVRDVFQVEVPLRSFFETPTVAELAVTIERSRFQDENDKDLLQMLEELERLSEVEVREQLKARGINDGRLL